MESAFPHADMHDKHVGMSLRDYFAGQAVIGLLQNTPLCSQAASQAGMPLDAFIADAAYGTADAMLERRKR